MPNSVSLCQGLSKRFASLLWLASQVERRIVEPL